MQNTEYHPNQSLQNKIKQLRNLLIELQPAYLAVSGGLDSRLLAFLADYWELDYRAIFFQGPQITPKEKAFTQKFLEDLNIDFSILEINPLQEENVAANNPDRCYYCKTFLFNSAQNLIGIPGVNILEGSHLSDLNEYRPGNLALQKLQIISPLARAGFYKPEIRECARYFKLTHWEQASRPCLLTRFAYGHPPQPRELELIAQAEDQLGDLGFRDFRIRVLADKYYLQMANSEKELYAEKEQETREVLSGLTPLEIFFTPQVSGFFDQNTPTDTGA